VSPPSPTGNDWYSLGIEGRPSDMRPPKHIRHYCRLLLFRVLTKMEGGEERRKCVSWDDAFPDNSEAAGRSPMSRHKAGLAWFRRSVNLDSSEQEEKPEELKAEMEEEEKNELKKLSQGDNSSSADTPDERAAQEDEQDNERMEEEDQSQGDMDAEEAVDTDALGQESAGDKLSSSPPNCAFQSDIRSIARRITPLKVVKAPRKRLG
ncbi:unnamed protein product, partial [Polarella glacialis]